MTHAAHLHRSTRLALAAGLAVSLTVAASPVALGQDGPEAPVQGLFDAIESKDYSSLATYFCDEFADQAAQLDFAAQMSQGLPPDMDIDINAMLDGFSFDTGDPQIMVIDEGDGMATLSVSTTLSMSIDPEAMRPFIELLLTSFGVDEITDEMVDQLSTQMMAEIDADPTQIDEQIIVKQAEDGTWQICSPIGIGPGGAEESPSPSASPSA